MHFIIPNPTNFLINHFKNATVKTIKPPFVLVWDSYLHKHVSLRQAMLVKLKAKMPSGDNDDPIQFSLVMGLLQQPVILESFPHRFKNVFLIL